MLGCLSESPTQNVSTFTSTRFRNEYNHLSHELDLRDPSKSKQLNRGVGEKLHPYFFKTNQLSFNPNNGHTEEEVLVRYQLSSYLLATLKAPKH